MSQDPGSPPPVPFVRREWRRILRWSALGVLLLVVGFMGWTGLRLWSAWRSVERIPFAIDEARTALPAPSLAPSDPSQRVWAPPNDAFTSYLLIGTDASDRKEVASADSITLFLDPSDAAPILVSLPRDLLVESPCTGEPARLAAGLSGCAGVGGVEVVALAVEGYTGIAVDHVAIFGFEGFVNIVDEFGGVELCVEHAFRYSPASTEPTLEAGCQIVDGYTALGWLRTRTPEELIDGEWVPTADGDAGRRRRQQDFLLAVLDELRRFRSVNHVVDVVGDLADSVVIDDGLSLFDAISRAWDLRGVAPTSIIRIEVEATPGVTPDGAFALVPVRPFSEELVRAFPPAAAHYA